MARSLDELVEVKKTKKIRVLPFYKRINPYYPVLVRTTVLEKLTRVAEKLPDNLFLQVDSGYRTNKTQCDLWNTRFKQFKGKKTSKTDQEIYEQVDKLVHNPKDGVPPHTTGGAVDVSLINKSGKELNLSEPYKKYYDEPQLKSNNITEHAQNQRVLLSSLMLSGQFAPNDKEYWHFSYGDKAWADYYKQKVLYESLDLGKGVEYRYFRKIVYRFIRICWKMYNKLIGAKTNY